MYNLVCKLVNCKIYVRKQAHGNWLCEISYVKNQLQKSSIDEQIKVRKYKFMGES